MEYENNKLSTSAKPSVQGATCTVFKTQYK